jgi:hypothetical protein
LGASTGQRGAAWRGLGGWAGGQGERTGGRARRRDGCLLLCACSRFSMVQRVLDVPPPRQPGARTRGCIAGAGRREAGRSGRRWAGWAGWCARWVGGGERYCKGHCTNCVCPAHTAHPRPSALCPTPQHAIPLPPAAPAPPTFLLCGVPCPAVGLDQEAKTRAWRRIRRNTPFVPLRVGGGGGVLAKLSLFVHLARVSPAGLAA